MDAFKFGAASLELPRIECADGRIDKQIFKAGMQASGKPMAVSIQLKNEVFGDSRAFVPSSINGGHHVSVECGNVLKPLIPYCTSARRDPEHYANVLV